MGSFVGIIDFSGKPVDKDSFNKCIEAISNWNTKGYMHDFNKSSAFSSFSLYQNTFAADSHYIPEHNIYIVGKANLTNTVQLAESFRFKQKIVSDLELISYIYLNKREDCVQFLKGSFGFMIFHPESNKIFCARDHLGLQPFYYSSSHNQFVFSSENRGVLEYSPGKYSINEDYLFDTLIGKKSEKTMTIYSEIKKLAPGHTLIINDNTVTTNNYWDIYPCELNYKDENDYIDGFRDILQQSVERSFSKKHKIGSELSGGIDSSVVTFFASQIQDLNTFSHVLPDSALGKTYPFKDERKYIDTINRACGISNSYKIDCSGIGILETINSEVSSLKTVTQQNYQIFSDILLQKASEHKVNILLSGFGGDEAVSSYSNGYTNELIYLKKYQEYLKDLRLQNISEVKINFKFLKSILKIHYSNIYRLFIYKSKKLSAHNQKYCALGTRFRERFEKSDYHNSQNKSDFTLNSQIIQRLKSSNLSLRLENSYSAALLKNIEYRYPLLDIDLIEFYLGMPSKFKAQQGISRYVVRKSMEGHLPDEIVWRNDKSGATIPSVQSRFLKDYNEIGKVFRSFSGFSDYINPDSMGSWMKRLEKRVHDSKNTYPGMFFNYMKMISFIKNNPTYFNG